MTQLQKATKRAEDGAEFLDKKLPGWFTEIDLDTLDLSNGCRCVLGQLATDIIPRKRWWEIFRSTGEKPSFGDAYGHLRLNYNRRIALGFVAGSDGVEYSTLTKAWAKIIRARRRELARELRGRRAS